MGRYGTTYKRTCPRCHNTLTLNIVSEWEYRAPRLGKPPKISFKDYDKWGKLELQKRNFGIVQMIFDGVNYTNTAKAFHVSTTLASSVFRKYCYRANKKQFAQMVNECGVFSLTWLREHKQDFLQNMPLGE